MEFSRIVGKNLKKEFFDAIDRHSPRLVEIFRCKRGIIGQQLTQLLQETKVGPYPSCTCIVFTAYVIFPKSCTLLIMQYNPNCAWLFEHSSHTNIHLLSLYLQYLTLVVIFLSKRRASQRIFVQ